MLSEEQKQNILTSYQNGKSINAIAKENLVSWDTVNRFLKKQDIIMAPYTNQFQRKQDYSQLFAQVADADTAYWLGFLYADGSIRSGSRNEIALELKAEDYETVKAFHIFCHNINTIREHIIERDGRSFKSYVSSFSNKQVKENLIKLGCVPKKSLILTCPSEQQVSDEFLFDFIRGYFDGDGYCRFDKEQHKYDIVILGTESFLKGLARRIGWEEKLVINPTATKVFKMTTYKQADVYEFLRLMYDNERIALPRKKQIFLQAKSGL